MIITLVSADGCNSLVSADGLKNCLHFEGYWWFQLTKTELRKGKDWQSLDCHWKMKHMWDQSLHICDTYKTKIVNIHCPIKRIKKKNIHWPDKITSATFIVRLDTVSALLIFLTFQEALLNINSFENQRDTFLLDSQCNHFFPLAYRVLSNTYLIFDNQLRYWPNKFGSSIKAETKAKNSFSKALFKWVLKQTVNNLVSIRFPMWKKDGKFSQYKYNFLDNYICNANLINFLYTRCNNIAFFHFEIDAV